MVGYRHMILAFILAWQFAFPSAQTARLFAESRNPLELPRVTKAFGALPMRFEFNAGQANPEVRFLSHGNGYSFFFTSMDVVISLSSKRDASKPVVLRMQLIGGNTHSSVEGLEELPGRSNYFQGNDSNQWRTDLPAYAKVRYAGVYPGIDLVYYGNGKQLEHDFVVAAGASADSIDIRLKGADSMHVDQAGDLVLLAKGEEIRLRKPIAYQEQGGTRHEVAVKYVLRGGQQVRFQLGPYDIGKPLVIDPVLSYSSYLGGSGADEANSLAVDTAGNMYIAGSTMSLDFPTVNALTPNSPAQGLCTGTRFFPPCSYIFVTKVTADGSALVYSSYLGGGFDRATGIAVDGAGSAYVTGNATSSNFPSVAPVMHQGQAFVLKLSPAGSALIYSTHFGGSNPNYGDGAAGIAVNGNGEAYVTGTTASPDFPSVNPLPFANCGDSVPFVAKFNAAGSALAFSTCLPSPQISAGRAIAVDVSGNAYVTGQLGADITHSIDAFVTKLSSSGSMIYSTRLSGSRDDIGFGIAADSAGNAFVTGITASTDFPAVNAFQPALAAGGDAFVTKLNPSGSIIYSTFLGGNDSNSGSDLGAGIAVDSAGRAYVAGITSSSNFPTVNAVQPVWGGNRDAFVAELNATGSTLVFSSYLGGSDSDSANAIALDGAGNVYVTGSTSSQNFPTVRPLQAAYKGAGSDPRASGGDAFVTKIGDTAVTTFPAITSINPNAASPGSQFTATVSGQNLGSALSVSFSGTGVDAALQPTSSVSNTLIFLRISIAGDAAIGSRSLTIGTSSGIVTMPNALVIQRGPVPATTPLPIPEVETGAVRSGYVIITPDAASSTPLTTLTFGMVSGGLVQSQAAILPTSLTTDCALQVDVVQAIGRNLGVAIANAGGSEAVITLTLRNEDGAATGSPASISIPAGQQLARFVTELFPSSTLGSAFRGSMSAQSSVPVSLIGVRFSGIEFSTLPILPNNPATVPLRTLSGGTIGGANAVMFSQFAISGGWATALGLVNATSSTITGRIDIFDTSGNPMAVRLNGTTQSTFNYSIPAKGTFTLAPRDANGQSPF
jgi:beta-propeller repeat-containing protein